MDGSLPGTPCTKAKRSPGTGVLNYLYTLTLTDPGSEWYTVVRDGDALLGVAVALTACTAKWPPWAATPTSSPTPTC